MPTRGLFIILFACGAALLSTEAHPGDLVCYDGTAPLGLFQLNVDEHSDLAPKPKQKAYSVHGKLSFTDTVLGQVMATVSGTVVTAEDTGAHMGLNVQLVRQFRRPGGDEAANYFPITLDCTSRDGDDSSTPATWICNIFGRNHPDQVFALNRSLSLKKDKECGFFQNGGRL
jgi:hypothetical protein